MITVVLPAYNEEKSIVPLIESIQKTAKKRWLEKVTIIIVDDGSADKTAKKVAALQDEQVVLIKHEENKGLGEAIKTGLFHAVNFSPDVDIVITMDSDNTHPPGLITNMIMKLDEGNDVVVASRYRSGARTIGVKRYRQFLSFGMSILFQILLPVTGVRDYSSGFRAYRADLLRQAFEKWGDDFVSEPGFSCMVDILLKLNRLDAIANEVPLILRYDHKSDKSKMNVAKTIKDTLSLAFRERFAQK